MARWRVMQRWSVVGTVVVVGALGGLSACGDDSAAPLDAVHQAGARLVAAGPARLDQRQRAVAQDGSEVFVVHQQLRYSGQGEEATGFLRSGDEVVSVRQTDDAVYLSSQDLLDVEEDAWVKGPRQSESPEQNLLPTWAMPEGPGWFAAMLGAADSATEAGRGTMNGRAVRRFEVTVPREAALGAARSAGVRVPDTSEEVLAEQIQASVFVDDAGDVRRVVFTMELPPLGATGATSVEVRTDVSQLGREVRVEIPPPDKVDDLPF